MDIVEEQTLNESLSTFPDLVEHFAEVLLDGVFRDVKCCGNLPGGEASHDKVRFVRAAGLGFEPRLTDPLESFPFRDTGGHRGTYGDKTALLSGFRYS